LDNYGNRWLSSGFQPYPGQTPVSNNFANNRWASGSGVTYDSGGNQLSVSLGAGGMRSFSYDGENRQVSAAIPNMASASYVYDGDGRRVKKLTGVTTTVFVYDAFGRLAAEYGSSNSLTGTTYITGDRLGSTRMVTDSTGTVTKRFDYAPFGEELTQGLDGRTSAMLYPSTADAYPSINPNGPNQKFTSQERDAETGLDYSFARYLSSAQGRFTSPDAPFADQNAAYPQSWNLYSHVRNNPLRYIDPTGRCSKGGGGYTDEGNGLFPGPCSGGSIGEQKAGDNSATVGVGRDEANLIMLQGIGEGLNSPHQIATIASKAGQGAMLLSSLRGLPSL
jgi:RHS repeat-associated protein